MKCSYFRSHIELLFDSRTPENERMEMLRHISECPACALHYYQTKSAAKSAVPQCGAHASSSLKARIVRAAAQAATAEQPVESAPNRKFLKRHWLQPLGALAVCALIAALIFIPGYRSQAHTARMLFHNAAAALSESEPFYLEMDVRTKSTENFSYIDAARPFVRHRMWVMPGDPGKWRLEKGGRAAFGNGQQIRMWCPNARMGWTYSSDASVIEDFSLLCNPRMLLLSEEALAADNPKATYRKEVEGSEIRLTVDMPASGDFTNDYLLNTSVSESDTHREYCFDRTTGRLRGMTISQRINGESVPVIRLQKIDYSVEITNSLLAQVPQDINWIDLTRPIGGTHFTGIEPEEAAQKLFAALHTWDESLLDEVFVLYPRHILKNYAGCRLLETKPAFRSGEYAGVFIPCHVSMADGSSGWINLALRNDNPAKAWVADGGI